MACSIIKVYPIFAFHLVVMYLFHRWSRKQSNNCLLHDLKVRFTAAVKLRISMSLYEYNTAACTDGLQTGCHQDRVVITIAPQTILNGFHGSSKIFIAMCVGYIFEVPVHIVE